MLHEVKVNVSDVCEYMCKNFDEVFNPEISPSSESHTARQKHEILFSDGESSFGDSSLNQSTFMFMNPEQFTLIADKLTRKKFADVS